MIEGIDDSMTVFFWNCLLASLFPVLHSRLDQEIRSLWKVSLVIFFKRSFSLIQFHSFLSSFVFLSKFLLLTNLLSCVRSLATHWSRATVQEGQRATAGQQVCSHGNGVAPILRKIRRIVDSVTHHDSGNGGAGALACTSGHITRIRSCMMDCGRRIGEYDNRYVYREARK